MSNDPALADILRELMHAKGWGQERLAQASGVSKKTIHNWLKSAGVRKPHTWQPLIKIARALGLSKVETNRLLQAAQQPALDRLLDQAQDQADHDLLQPWSQATPHNLPHQVTSFVGRNAEIAAVGALLDQARLVLLSGPGGSGKTRLALTVAQMLVERFGDGVWFVDLAPLDDPRLVVPTIAQTLNLPEIAHASLDERLKQYLRPRQTLLILDNFEQVIEAAPAISSLLAAAPRLTILVTSRTVLRISGEQEFVVPPLPLPQMVESPPDELLVQAASVALFVQRAQAINPAFQLTAENAHSIAEICIRLDGLPLAIELAAAWTKVLSPQSLQARLVGASGQRTLDLLQQGARDLPSRHRTLHATIDWSYALLDPEEQRLFARLAVFVNGWTLELAEVVCCPDDQPLDVLHGVTALVDHSLLVHAASDEHQRFGMLATIREYALEQLDRRGETEDLRRRHAAAYVVFVENASQFLCGPQQQHWLRRLRSEHDNLRAALIWTLNTGELEQSLRLVRGLWEFWAVQGHISEGRRWLAQLLAHDCRRYPVLHAEMLRAAGRLAFHQGDYVEAHLILSQALTTQQALNDPHGILRAINDLAVLAREQGNYEQAYALHTESLRLARESNNEHAEVHTLISLGQNAIHAGDHEQAQRYIAEAIGGDDETSDPMGLAVITASLGSIAYLQRDYPRAAELWQKSLTSCQIVDDRLRATRTLCRLGDALLRQGSIDEARGHYLTSLRLCRDVTDKLGIIENLAGLGAIALHQGNLIQATRLSITAAGLRQRLGIALPAASRRLLEETLSAAAPPADAIALPPPLALVEAVIAEVIADAESTAASA